MNVLNSTAKNIISTLLVLFIFCIKLKAQSQQVVQLTGVVVVNNNNQIGVPGVHIYTPSHGRGTTSNLYGYFSMPALIGDQLTLSAVGFLKQKFTVPQGKNGRVNIIFKMVVDTIYLNNIDITPFLSERIFKKTILAMSLPSSEEYMEQERLSRGVLSEMSKNMPYDASLNASHHFNQHLYHMQDSYGPRVNPLLNPINWINFISSLRKK